MANFTADQIARQARMDAARAAGQTNMTGRVPSGTYSGTQNVSGGGGLGGLKDSYTNALSFENQRSAPTAYEVRGQGLSSVASPYSEVLKTMPRTGGQGVFSYEYYTYDQVSKSQAGTIGFYRQQSLGEQKLWERAGAELGRSGHSLYADYVELSAYASTDGARISPFELLMSDLSRGAATLADDGSGSGSGSYGGGGGGSNSTIVLSNREDARSVIDTLALQMVGRTVNDKEFEQYFSALNAAERANPTVVSMEGGSVVQQSGMSSAGREQVLADQLRKNDDFAEFQVGGQMVGMFQQYLNEKGVFNG